MIKAVFAAMLLFPVMAFAAETTCKRSPALTGQCRTVKGSLGFTQGLGVTLMSEDGNQTLIKSPPDSNADIAVPVAVWQGDQDTMVPIAHGRWLAANLPTAAPHLLPGDGHMSAGYEHMDQIVADLITLAR